jgi:NitT/TauT family transport system substrate-binding protein
VAEPLSELLRRCRAGHDDAVAELVGRFCGGALSLAGAILADAHLAEDAVQEAFLTALQRLADLRDLAAFPGWFRQVVRTQSLRIARRRRERTGADVPEVAGREAPPPERLARDELRQRVREELAKLPPKGRRTAELYYLDGRACDDVAKALGVPSGTVKRRLHDVRRRLRSMLLGTVEPEAPAREPPPPPELPL